MSSFLLGGIIGLLLGLAYCYWKQIKFAYQNQGVISSGGDLISAAQNFWANVQKI